MFRCRKSLAVLMTLCFLFTMAVPGFASETGSTGVLLEEARDGIVGYYLENKTELDSWREVVGLKEAGQDLSRAPWKLPDWQVDSLDKESDPTRYAGTILGMLAVGQDPTQVAVSDQVYRDLVAELAGMQQEDGSFGGWLNQTIWSIIALDEAGGNYSTEKAISFLLSQQKTDGGFALSGDTADPDTTGDALLALASHKDVAGVSDAIDKAIECLKKIQLPNGGFVSWGSETPESAAAVIRGLLACGEKDITSGDWQKEKGNMIDALFAFQLEDGSFVHSTSETKYNSMATEQALMAVADLVNAGINYTVETGKRHGGEQTEATVRVRVEGATESLADETVTVTGTALDALKAAVGEENLVANGDAVFSIYGECGTRIKKGLYSGWMYYVIRDGAVDLDAFNLSTGSYNVQDGDELVFYIAAYQTSAPYAVKTYLPDVQVTPTNPTAGQTVTISIAAKKLNDMWDGLVPITPEEAAEVGDYKVLVGDQEYTSQFGQVTIQDVPEGTLNFTVTNYNEAGYPNVVTYKGSIDVQPLVSSTARVRVEGATGSLADKTVDVTGTALDALKTAVGEENVDAAPSGFINSILGEGGEKISDDISTSWMYYVIRDGAIDEGAFSQGAGSFNVQDGDEVVFYIGAMDSATWAAKTFFPQVEVTPETPKAGQDLTLAIKVLKYDWMAGLVDLTPEELQEIGEFTVTVGEQEYRTQDGQVTIPAVSAGVLSFTVQNFNEAGYPNVVTYKGSIDVQQPVLPTARVRVEGATASLADETVDITGTALDALKAAVGEENVDAPGGFINSILGEGGEKISDDISTSWMYYVIRDGAIDEGAFSQGAGSFNVQDGDEVVFFIKAMDSTTWAAKTFFPQVDVTPQSPKAGRDFTLKIKVLRDDWSTDSLEILPLTAEELQEIGEFTVTVGDQEYRTQDRQVTIPTVSAGVLSFTLTNFNEAGYPNVVTYKGKIQVSSSGGSGGSVTSGRSVRIAVVGSDGNLLFGPSTVEIREGATHGYTPLGALDATRLNYTLASGYSGFVNSISGQANSGLSGWMFTVNDESPMDAADKVILRDGDQVIWYYSKDINDPLPRWDDLKRKGGSGLIGTTTPVESLDTVKEKLKDFEAGKLSVSELITVISDEISKLKDAELTEDQKEQFASAAQQVAESLENTEQAIRVWPGGGEVKVKIDGKKIKDFADCLAKARELSAKLKELEIEDVGSLVRDSLVVELPADKTLDQAVTVILPVEAGQALIEKRLPLVIAGPEVSCSIPSEAVKTVLGAVDEAADIEISARKVSVGKVNIEGAALVGEKALELDISAVTAGGEKEKPESDFEKPVTFTISLAGVDTEKLDAKRIAVYRKNKADSWEYVGGKLAADRQSFSFKTQSTSLYALMEFQRTFPDIEGHWGQDEIESMAMRLIAKGMGDGTFAPDQKITRAQFAALLVNALELPCKSPEKQSFKDVPASYWGYSSIETAFDAGLISGVGDGRFNPERGITREEIASLTARALKKCGAELELSGKAEELLEKFKDSGEVSAWARDDLAAVVSKEIITGRNGAMLSPKTGATRAEAVVVLKKLLQNLGRI